MPSTDIPANFIQTDLNMGYSNLIGPFYRHTDYPERLALRVLGSHCNLANLAHGGLLTSLADIAMGRLAVKQNTTPQRCLTVNLSYDFLQAAPLGCWLEAQPKLERQGKSLVFASCELFADQRLIGQARCVLKYLGSALGNSPQA